MPPPEQTTLHCRPGGQTKVPPSIPVADGTHCPLPSHVSPLPHDELPGVQSATQVDFVPQYNPAPQSELVEQCWPQLVLLTWLHGTCPWLMSAAPHPATSPVTARTTE
ncbi:MAG TPA: hypothetical protein VGL86_08300 [Polyangia bacterium]